uniref:Uncharacterized protein n=1 Tax=Lepeophtheirus salmonis TaxID=72036 RepID=A0A0K2UIK4_LEPSM
MSSTKDTKLRVFNTTRYLFPTYLSEYMCRKKLSKDKVFDHILDPIIELYPL